MRLYRVYTEDDKEVAVIKETQPLHYELDYITEKQSELPFLLQGEKSELDSDGLAFFLKRRILPLERPCVAEYLTANNISREDTVSHLIKRNSGRTLKDSFYVLVEENGVLSKKSTKTQVTEVKVKWGNEGIWGNDDICT